MEEQQDDRAENAPEQSFEELLAQSMAGSPRLEPGDKVEATVLKIGAEWVFLDVGQKGEGVLDIKELLDADGKLSVSKGDTVYAYFLGREEDELLFTTRMGGGASGTAQLEQAWASGIPVEGRLELEINLLVSWGLFRRDGSFIPVEGTPEPETVAQLFRHRVLRLLLEEGAIEEGVVRNLLAWPHTGFGTHVSRAIPADATTPGVVARYMARPPITPERMLGETSGPRIIYRSDAVHPRHQFGRCTRSIR